MELKMKDMIEILQAHEKDILKMIKIGKLPAHMINHQYMFNKQEIKEWIIRNGIKINRRFLGIKLGDMPVSVARLMERGGIIFGAKGRTPSEIFSDAVARMPAPPELKKEDILASLIEREEMMPTAVGMGIAIPHPHRPIISDVKNESITVCVLSKPIDYKAPDSAPVHTMFIVLSANSKRHLEILSKLLFICQQEDFTDLLKNGSPAADILKMVWEKEALIEGRVK
jgi:PTS system nitrogen regulatory IIA component